MREFGILVDFDEIQDKEAKAFVGSVFALLREGMNLSEFQSGIFDSRYKRAFQTAREIFERNIYSKPLD